MYKKGIKSHLRFQTPKGPLSIEQLIDLSQEDIATTLRQVRKLLKKNENDDELSFLDDTKQTAADVENQLRFEILKDIYLDKKKEAEDLRSAAENKKHNEKILALIAEKQEGKLREMSVEELEKLLKQ